MLEEGVKVRRVSHTRCLGSSWIQFSVQGLGGLGFRI